MPTEPPTNEPRPEPKAKAGKPSPAEIERFEEVVANALMARQEFLTRFFDRRRDYPAEYGWKQGPLTAWDYKKIIDRNPIAARAVEVYPNECWQVQPEVYESEDPEEVTPFEASWENLCRGLRPIQSHCNNTTGNPIWEALRRLHQESRKGRYGIMVIGFSQGKLDEAVKPQKGLKVEWLRVFPETLAEVSQYDNDPASLRYLQPVTYNVTFGDTDGLPGGTGYESRTMAVHYTRVLHYAPSLASSEVYGVCPLQHIADLLGDLKDKLYGACPEMYFRGALPGLSFETHPSLGANVKRNKEGLRNEVESYMNGLQRYLGLYGMTAKSLAPQVVDPTPQINALLEAVCIRLAVPKRIFVGSERGELASGQDEDTWSDRVRQVQENDLTPRMVMPLIDLLIFLQVLETPGKGYWIWWPDISKQSDQQKADVTTKRVQALVAYASSEAPTVVAPIDFLTLFMDLTPEEAKEILERAEVILAQRMEEEAAAAAAAAAGTEVGSSGGGAAGNDADPDPGDSTGGVAE